MLVPLLIALTAGSVALGLFVHRAVERDQMKAVDVELARALNAAFGRLDDSRRPVTSTSTADDVEAPLHYVIAPDGAVVGRPDNGEVISDAQLADVLARGKPTTVGGDPRYRADSQVTSGGITIVTALSLRTVDASLASLRHSLLLGGAVLVAIQALVVVLVARRVTAPVARLSGVAHRIASGDFTADIGPSSGPRETAALATDLSAMLTRLLHAIEEREVAAADAERARLDMERFMADASHELRTPLTAIRGYSELYGAGMLDAEGLDRAMARIGGESVRLASLVRDLLQLVQPSDARHGDPVDVAAVVSAVVHDLRAAHPSHTIGLDLTASDGCTVRGDAARLHQAILNLGANACQHTPDGTDVVVVAARQGAEAVIEVVDRGQGIDPRVAESLFMPFTRGEVSRSRSSHDGAGLGLAIAERVVRQHDGSIAAGGTPGGGATFTIRLPIHAASSPESSPD